MKEQAWRRLLDMIADRMVVPVIGSRLLVDNNGADSLQARVARRVLQDYEVDPQTPLPCFRELNETVNLLRNKVDNPQDLYGDIESAYRGLRPTGQAVPKPLRQLAEISDFRLFVTLTPDDLLAQALRDGNRAVNEIVHSPKLPTSEGADLPVDWQRPGGPVQLLYLFGKARPTPLFCIHDEDVLEYAHNIIARGSHAPTSFLGSLQDRNLLLIGCNFPEWLSRFILRATRKGRLGERERGREWLIEPLATEDPFIGFLGRYSPETTVLTHVGPIEFVEQLHLRWMAEHGSGAGHREPASMTLMDMSESAMFFVSYSRTTDLASAVAFCKTLRDLGVAENEIWMDQETLETGDIYTRRISDGIRTCRYFVPLVSRGACARDQAFVFREWEEATRLLPEMNRRYLLPLAVDAENRPEAHRQPSVAHWRDRGINFGHAPNGVPDAMTGKLLKELVRDARAKV